MVVAFRTVGMFRYLGEYLLRLAKRWLLLAFFLLDLLGLAPLRYQREVPATTFSNGTSAHTIGRRCHQVPEVDIAPTGRAYVLDVMRQANSRARVLFLGQQI